MKIKLSEAKERRHRFLDQYVGPKLGEKRVSVVVPDFILTREDKKKLTEVATRVWKKILDQTGSYNFKGLIRFDLVPEVDPNPSRDADIYNLGKVGVDHVYEVNAHSPEGVAASVALRQAVKNSDEQSVRRLGARQPDVVSRLARAVKDAFGGRRIAFVPGFGDVKEAWADIFFQVLKETGILNIEKMSAKEAMKKDNDWVIWRWGDLEIGNPDGEINEYNPELQKWLQRTPKDVFNTVPKKPERDVADKSLLLKLSENGHKELIGDSFILESEEDFNLAKERQSNLVLKPLRGSSGDGIIFGIKESLDDWHNALANAYGEGHGLFQVSYLPRIDLPPFERPFAFDLNPGFFADGEKLTWIHAVTRADFWSRYWRDPNSGEFGRLEMNVAQGAGYHGSLIEEAY